AFHTFAQASMHRNPPQDSSVPVNPLGKEGEPLEIRFGDGAEPIISRIDRTANSSGAVRVVGRNRQIAQWLQRNFEQGEIVEAQICNPNSILLLPKLR
ncbi:GIY-YIG nuclease family protein, partial [Labrys sp. ZIDIC5]|nr:GIY-YIG nuclease family protein [Labrys sp. ZIDIC5]